jgi:threonine aldolase
MEAFCADGLWLVLAGHANAMADRLASGLELIGIKPIWPVEANEVFVSLPVGMDMRLKAAGALYHRWEAPNLSPARDTVLVRLVTSFLTSTEEVDRFFDIARSTV